FYITINPTDVYNPIVKFLAGSEIDIDDMLLNKVPDFWGQSILVARNPTVTVKFFNLYIKSFLSAILGFDKSKGTAVEGILGHVKAYYGCVK
ncbi:uncharacterized protein BJ212DRAFT_1236168, partial [Suillus subaureus]